MIYVFGEPPQWLIDAVRELGEEIVRINDCNAPPRSIVISVNSECAAKGFVALSLMPYGGVIPIQRNTARGILSTVINLTRRIGNAKGIDDALSSLGFIKTQVINAFGVAEVVIRDQVIPGSIYTVIVLNEDGGKCVVTLGRGTARGTLILDSSISWLLSNGGDVRIARGDLVLELMALSMIFGINLIHSNPPY
ncbi:hypothetical protein JCM16161A_11750 [Vulcanisaeta sp. JCM 16161]|uniref:hypothetical protein n=1 Tax=Vulcanisaeta sp. JCM 16161 TaxID=1295372 RepID=UPI0006D218CD|nr:hypothetical protein [Vulcanisaeta sp. JCM 16161]